MADKPAIYVVDDDEAIRDSLGMLLDSVGKPHRAFASGEELLDAFEPTWSGCIVLDIRMPGISGMELQGLLLERQSKLPIIFVTGHGDVPMAVEAMHKGAFDFIQKPFRDHELLERVEQALLVDADNRSSSSEADAISARFETLTPREKEVMNCVVTGQANKVIAMDLGLSQRTVEVHRARVMEKMGVRSLAELVRQALQLESA